MKKILVIDNRDSFVYNLIEYLRINGKCEVDVVLSDCVNFDTLDEYDGILFSPGAGIPADYPNMWRVIDQCKYSHSMLGVCLGHQAIAEYFGASLFQLELPRHGHCSNLKLLEGNRLTEGIVDGCSIGRYHSWIVSPYMLSNELKISATDEDGNVMMIRHKILPIYGVQFHPESIITEQGQKMINNWIEIINK